MFWIALILLGLAIALWRRGHQQTDDVMKLLLLSFALISVMTGLVTAPWPMKFLIFAGLLVYPTCASAERVLKSDCPRYCLRKSQCRPGR
jgi:hypothetical protein